MPDKIDITHSDDVNVEEKIGEAKKPLHQKLFDEFNIKVTDENAVPLRPIPMSWVFEIIEFNILSTLTNNKGFIKTNMTKDQVKRLFTITFDSKENVIGFEEEFQKNMFNAINDFIDSKNEKPRLYSRNIITTTQAEGLQLTISY